MSGFLSRAENHSERRPTSGCPKCQQAESQSSTFTHHSLLHCCCVLQEICCTKVDRIIWIRSVRVVVYMKRMPTQYILTRSVLNHDYHFHTVGEEYDIMVRYYHTRYYDTPVLTTILSISHYHTVVLTVLRTACMTASQPCHLAANVRQNRSTTVVVVVQQSGEQHVAPRSRESQPHVSAAA